MPGDPQVNEDVCLQILRGEITLETLEYVQNAALSVIIDLYDRKAVREEFMKHAGTAVSLYATLAKLFIVAQTHTLLSAGKLTPDEVEKYRVKLLEGSVGKARVLAGVMELLRECATSEDKVH